VIGDGSMIGRNIVDGIEGGIGIGIVGNKSEFGMTFVGGGDVAVCGDCSGRFIFKLWDMIGNFLSRGIN